MPPIFDVTDDHYPRVTLADAWPDLSHDLAAAFVELNRPELAEDASRLSIPAQRLGGNPGDFSFLTFSLPRLTREQRYAMEFRVNEEEFKLSAAGASVRVVLDNFDRINWLYVSGVPGRFEPLQAAIQAQRGER
jgi:hypothetical protein